MRAMLLLLGGVQNVQLVSSDVTAVSVLMHAGSAMVSQIAMMLQTSTTVVSCCFYFTLFLSSAL